MKRSNRRRPRHAKPPQAQQTVTAIIIISFFIAALLVGLILLICATHKLAGGVNGKLPNLSPVVSSSPLGGDTAISTPSIASEGQQATTHILVEEPLVGGTGVDKERAVQSSTPAPRERQAIEAMQVEVVEAQKARVRADLVARIDRFLGNSPMRGLGEVMMQNAERTGVWVMLCPTQAYAESSLGAVCCYPFQAWGMYGVHPSSWEDAIARYFDNIVKHWGQAQGVFELRGYCVPDHPYMENVQRLAESI